VEENPPNAHKKKIAQKEPVSQITDLYMGIPQGTVRGTYENTISAIKQSEDTTKYKSLINNNNQEYINHVLHLTKGDICKYR